MIVEALAHRIEGFAARLAVHPLLSAARAGAVTPACVARYLASAHFLICHTQPNLERAREAALLRGRDELAAFYASKASEERGHELWAKSDLAELGRRFGLQGPFAPCRAIEELVAELEHAIPEEPAAFLAYILFAEYFTVLMGPPWIRALEQSCGVPPGALTVVSRHVELDREHVAEARREIGVLTRPEDEASLHEMLAMAMAHFAAFCDELVRSLGDERAA